MNNSMNSIKVALYVILGVVIMAVAIRVVWKMMVAVSQIVLFLISLAIVIVIGYVIYRLIRSAFRKL